MKRYLIFTDLDGTLLDHDNYSLGNNKKMISTIINNKNEIIFNTSKTFSECKKLLKELKLSNMPFSTENGAVLYFPKIRFNKIKNSSSFEKYWKVRIAKLSSLELNAGIYDQKFNNLNEAIKAIDAYRLQINQRLLEIDRQLNSSNLNQEP